MKINTNLWNKIRYTLAAPIYDPVANIFKESRRLSIEALNIHAGDKVLIVGAGTGLDLAFLPKDCEITATDLTAEMVRRIQKRNKDLHRNLKAEQMDGMHLTYESNTFDHVILHLILAVIPDPVPCLQEAERVLKPGGKLVVFDKFVPKNQGISLVRKVFNIPANILFTNISRYFEDMHKHTQLTLLKDVPSGFGGNFRRILLEKK